MTYDNWNQEIETSIILLGAMYALCIVGLIIWAADKAGF